MARKPTKARGAKPSTQAAAASAVERHSKPWLMAVLCVALFVAGLAPYLQTAGFGFVNFDDSAYVYRNPQVLSGLSWEGFVWALTTDAVCNWHPLTWLSLQLDVSLFGVRPGAHHVINAILHALNGVLLFLVLRAMTKEMWASVFVAALFALHPLHVESVAWIAERKDVLSGFFWLLTIAAYVWYVQRPGMARMALACVLFAFGLTAKPMLVTLPAVLLLLDFWPLKRLELAGADSSPFRVQPSIVLRLLLEKAPFVLLAAVSSVITFVVQRSGGGVVTVDAIPVWARLANVPVAYVRYILMTLWPAHLGVFYPHLRTAIPLWQPFLASAVLIAVTAALLVYWRSHPYGIVGWLWYLGTLVPVIGIVQVGDQALADRYTYIPHIGVFCAVVWLVLPVARKHARLAAAAGCIVLTTLGIRTYVQTATWRDTITLFENSLRVAPDNYRAHKGLGVAYADDLKQYDKALEHCLRAAALDPADESLQYNLGNAYAGLSRLEEAVGAYRKALQMNANLPDAQYNLGIALARLKRYDEAIKAFQETLRLDPHRAGGYNNLGSALAMSGQFEAALAQYQRATELQPNDPDAWCNTGYAYSQLGKPDEAREAYNQALRYSPGNARAAAALKALSAR